MIPSPAAAEAALRSDAMRGLIAKFDAAWGERVIRDRNIVEVSEMLTRETEPRAAEGA
jgi:hypothetical protein